MHLLKGESANNRTKIPAVPNLILKEGVAGLCALAVITALSASMDAPLEGPADPTGIPGHDVKAPWIFVGIQQLLRYFPAGLAGIAFPMAALVVLALVPTIASRLNRSVGAGANPGVERPLEQPSRKSFPGGLLAGTLFFGIIGMAVALTLVGLAQ